MSEISRRLELVQERIAGACGRSGRSPGSVRLVAVTKNHPAGTVQELIDLGVHDIGENRSAEIEEKAPQLRGVFTLHMIGHLQTNKVARILPYVHWIQSIDRLRLVDRIEYLSAGPRKLKTLVEVNTSGESSKSGCAPAECRQLCERVSFSKALQFCGLMTIGPLEGGEKQTRAAFGLLRKLGEEVSDLAPRIELSMGMSGDFEWAIEEGSTMVRIGTLLLGERKR